MRELQCDELFEVSGGFSFVDAVATGSAVGATGYGGYTLATGAAAASVAATVN